MIKYKKISLYGKDVPQEFFECVKLLGHEVQVATKRQAPLLWNSLFIPFKKHSLVDWQKLDQQSGKTSVAFDAQVKPQELIATLEHLLGAPLDPEVLILWNDDQIPPVITDLHKAVKIWDKLCKIDGWDRQIFIVNYQQGYLIEKTPTFVANIQTMETDNIPKNITVGLLPKNLLSKKQ